MERDLNPPVFYDFHKEDEFIRNTIFDVAEDIVKRGGRTRYHEIYEMLYEHLQENIDDYQPEKFEL